MPREKMDRYRLPRDSRLLTIAAGLLFQDAQTFIKIAHNRPRAESPLCRHMATQIDEAIR